VVQALQLAVKNLDLTLRVNILSKTRSREKSRGSLYFFFRNGQKPTERATEDKSGLIMRRDRNTVQNSYYSTRELAKLFRVDHTTIRRWADSGKLRCFRSPGGHRKFTPKHIAEFISKYHYEVLPPRFGFSCEPEKEGLLSLISSRDFHTLSEVFFAEACRVETDKLKDILSNCYHADIPLVDIYDIIIRKAVGKILKLQKDEKLSEANKHVYLSSIVESLNEFQSSTQKSLGSGRVAICASPANGLEEVVFLGVSHLLRATGWKVYDLGANTPVNVLTKAIEEYEPTLVCASGAYLVQKEGQRDCVMLEEAAALKGAELLYFCLKSGEIDTRESISAGAARKMISSLKELVPYATKPSPMIGVQKKDLKGTLTPSDAVESTDAPNE
jgi:excisionase family DNA binding protein